MLVKGLKVKFGNRIVLKNVTIKFEPGINLILGPNGSGKTTLLRTIIGMIKPYEGEIINHEDFSYSPAEFNSPSIKVKDVLYAGKKRGNYEEMIKLVGLDSFLDRDFSTLSSGEKRKVLLAKALAEGNLILLDEPLSNLDVANRKVFLDILLKLKEEKQFILTSHELETINYADYVILMKDGEVVYQGDKEGLTEDLLSKVYGIGIRKIKVGDFTFFLPY